MDLITVYFFLNNFWYIANILMIPTFSFTLINRYRNPSMDTKLLSDYVARLFMFFTVLYYIIDVPIKYMVDGINTTCEKAFLIHHISSIFVITPLILNPCVPWWINTIGLMHGLCVVIPDNDIINIVYFGSMLLITYKLRQEPFRSIPGYNITNASVGLIYVYVILVTIWDCTNFLPLSPQDVFCANC